jgi:hypothetical protein
MKEDWNGDSRRVSGEAGGHVDRGWHGLWLLQAVFPEYCAAQAGTCCGDERQPEAGAHREARVGDTAGVDQVHGTDGIQHCEPVVHHAVGDSIYSGSCHLLLVLATVERLAYSVAVVRAVDGYCCDLRFGEAPGQL